MIKGKPCQGIHLFYTVPSSPPQNIHILPSSRTLFLTWDPPAPEYRNGIILGYTVNITEAESTEIFQTFSDTNDVAIHSLKPFTTYLCAVAAETAAGLGPYNEALTVITLEDGKQFRTAAYTKKQYCKVTHNSITKYSFSSQIWVTQLHLFTA